MIDSFALRPVSKYFDFSSFFSLSTCDKKPLSIDIYFFPRRNLQPSISKRRPGRYIRFSLQWVFSSHIWILWSCHPFLDSRRCYGWSNFLFCSLSFLSFSGDLGKSFRAYLRCSGVWCSVWLCPERSLSSFPLLRNKAFSPISPAGSELSHREGYAFLK